MNTIIFNFLYGFAHQSAIGDQLIILLAKYFPYAVIMIAGLFLLFHHDVFKADNPFRVFLKKKKEIIKVFISGIVAWVLAYIIKMMFHMPRPFDAISSVTPLLKETGYAFPSGHATFFSALAVTIFLMHKKAGYWFMAFALVIGIARVMAGVHYPIDILGGFVLGSLIAYIFKNLVRA